MAWVENRILMAEQRIESLYRRLQAVEDELANVRQQLRQAFAQTSQGGGGAPAEFLVCFPTSAVSGATWTAGVPTTGSAFTITVYQVSNNGTSQVITNLGSQTCTNWLPAGLAPNLAVLLAQDGAGGYGVLGQSCS